MWRPQHFRTKSSGEDPKCSTNNLNNPNGIHACGGACHFNKSAQSTLICCVSMNRCSKPHTYVGDTPG